MTKGILHFEDLDPKMFEAMCCNIIVESGLYDDIRPYGIDGADEGVDIFCVEKKKPITLLLSMQTLPTPINF